MKTNNTKQNEIYVLIEKIRVNEPWKWEVYDYRPCRSCKEAFNIMCKRNNLTDTGKKYELININDFEPYDWAKMLSCRHSHYSVSMLFSMGFEFIFDLAKQIAMEEVVNGHILLSLRLFLQHCKEVTEYESETEYIYTYTCGNESITIDFEREKILINE